ncbi:MAG: ANTAR domain-containing protein [Lachnospiraceae bacterium]|nr:ANTAR domain-containing protein [Lachnospiraceae bacterium]
MSSLRERIYSVLIVSAAEKINTALDSLLPDVRYGPVTTVSSVSAAERLFAERSFDYVIINSPLPDDAGVRFAIDTLDTKGTVTLLLVRSEIYNDIFERVASHGVFVLSKPVNRPMLVMALDWMASMRERMRRMEKKTLSVEEKMEEIRAVNRAKWLLIRELSMDEPAAHRYIEKQAMDRCVTRLEVANEIIKTYS